MPPGEGLLARRTQAEGLLARLQIPHPDGIVLTLREQFAIVTWPQAPDSLCMPAQCEGFFARLPPPLGFRLLTLSVCRRIVRDSFPASRSPTLMVLSSLPEKSHLPSTLRARLKTLPVCPRKVRVSLPDSLSHTLIVLSSLPEN